MEFVYFREKSYLLFFAIAVSENIKLTSSRENMKAIYVVLSFTLLACGGANIPPITLPPPTTPSFFTVSSNSIIQTIYASETTKFELFIKYVSKKNEPVHFKILNPATNLSMQFSEALVTKSKKINLVIQSFANTDEAKYKLLIEAQSVSQRLIYPIILNVVKKGENSPVVVMDFVTANFNSYHKTDAIIGKIVPGAKGKADITFSSRSGATTTHSVTTDKNGNFVIPANNMAWGLYNVEVIFPQSHTPFPGVKARGQIFVNSPNDIVSLSLQTNNPRLLDNGDKLIVSGSLKPSPGLVPIELEIIEPKTPSNPIPDTLKSILDTDSLGNFQHHLPVVALTPRGIYKIIARYDPHHSSSHIIPQVNPLNRDFGIDTEINQRLFANNNAVAQAVVDSGASEHAYFLKKRLLPREDPISRCRVECVVRALLGINTRPGIVLVIVGGNTIVNSGNPYYCVQTSLANKLFVEMITGHGELGRDPAVDPNWRQFVRSDFVYFNPQQQSFDVHGVVTESVTYDKANILARARTQILDMAGRLNSGTDAPLYVIMLGQGIKVRDDREVEQTYFRISGTRTGDMLNGADITEFLAELTAVANSTVTRISRAFLSIDCDYAGLLANSIISARISLPRSPPYCKFVILTSSSDLSKMVYPGTYEDSFTWKFFSSALGFSRHPGATMTEAQILQDPVFNLKKHFDDAKTLIIRDS